MINTIMASVAFNMTERIRQIRNAIYFVVGLLTGYRLVKHITLLIY